MIRPARDEGMALVMVLLTLTLAMVLGAGLVLSTSSEVLVSATFTTAEAAFYAAEAAAEWATVDVARVAPDWTMILDGTARSSFRDGAATGTRLLADGSSIDLAAIVAEQAGWRLHAYGSLRDLLPPVVPPNASSPYYALVFVAADAAAADRLKLRAEAFGPRGARKTVELGLLRDGGGVHTISWTEVR